MSEPLGSRIRAAREARKLSLFRAGAAAGIDPGYWSRAERGLANPSIATASRMAAAVGLDDVVEALGAMPERQAS